jgi:asparagine synthase (glutamine-hydrolysing)
LLRLIREKGYDALKLVNGDFTGAIYDIAKGEWTLFRDHMGVRPLYVYNEGGVFAFSTDIRGILAIPGIDNEINYQRLYKLLIRFQRLSQTETDFAKIQLLYPGSVCTFRAGPSGFEMTQHIYWQPGTKKIRLATDDDYRKELRRLVTDSVHRRCDAISGLLGAELSGGLDSSIIDIILHRHGRKAVYYSWSVDPSVLPITNQEDERSVVLDICRQEGIECRFMLPEDRFDLTYCLQQAMPSHIFGATLSFGSNWMHSQGARVVFSGHGGDEGVSHRARCYELAYHREYLPYYRIFWHRMKGRKMRLLRTFISGTYEYLAWKKQRKQPLSPEILNPVFLETDFCQRMTRECSFPDITYSYDPLQYVRMGGSQRRLENAAFFGAFSGVRYLFPYIDYRVMDFALSIPRRLHINEKTNRAIFRETFADLMPASLREVQYKDVASTRNVDVIKQTEELVHRNIRGLLDRIDRALWDGVVDFEGLESMLHHEVDDETAAAKFEIVANNLNHLLLIQNVMKESKRWRERNG